MPLFGAIGALVVAFCVAAFVDISGNVKTRWFTRRAFALVALRTFGLTIPGIVEFASNTWGLLPL